MKITEVITRLQEILAAEGDLDVTCWPYDGQSRHYDVGTIEAYDASEGYTIPGHKEPTSPAQRVVNIDT